MTSALHLVQDKAAHLHVLYSYKRNNGPGVCMVMNYSTGRSYAPARMALVTLAAARFIKMS